MPAKEKTCKYCKVKKAIDTMVQINLAWYCDWDHGVQHGKELAAKTKERAIRKADIKREKKIKAKKAETRLRKKEVMTRNEWYKRLQTLVNQYVLHVRDKDKGCCTCGKYDIDGAFDAGHYLTRGARPDVRFELTNISKQCVKCNLYDSGKPKEHAEYIARKYGEKHLEWLHGKHPDLKERFPTWHDIESEIKRYRAILREHGVRPYV